MALTRVLLLLKAAALAAGEEPWFDFAPLISPVLGDSSDDCSQFCISKQCKADSVAYLEGLNRSDPLSLMMFDAGGTPPFLNEGMLAEMTPIQMCNLLEILSPDMVAACHTLPSSLTTLYIPVGHANGPGSRAGCAAVQEAGAGLKTKYCHNYLVPYIPTTDNGKQFQTNKAGSTRSSKFGFQFPLNNELNFSQTSLLDELQTRQLGQDLASLPYIKSIQSLHISGPVGQRLTSKTGYLSKIQAQVREVLSQSCAATHGCDDPPPLPTKQQMFGLYLLFWYYGDGNNGLFAGNIANGVGNFGYLPPLPFFGSCIPASCSYDDIHTNSLLFNQQFVIPQLANLPPIYFNPLIPGEKKII